MKAPKQSKPAAEGHKNQTRQPFLQRKPGAADRPFISTPTTPQIQPKLTVNQPGDRYEQEADRMAERVMRMPSENEAPPMISRMRAGGPVQRKCSACEQEDKEKQVVQRQSNDNEPTHASDDVAQRLQSRKGQGAPLPPNMNQRMGGVFGQDFSNVRLHTDDEAIQMSRDLNAQAFTYGQDIYFDSGKYQPETNDGKRLLGHELTHTVQQGGGIKRNGRKKKSAGGKEALPAKPKKNIFEATQNEIEAVKENNNGCIKILESKDEKKLLIYLNNIRPKSYLWKEDIQNIQLPKEAPKPGERKKDPTQQVSIWKKKLKEPVSGHLSKIIGISNGGANKIYSVGFRNELTAYIGNFEQIVDKISIPFWDINNRPRTYEVEHMIDYQLVGKQNADDISNLILLDAEKNRREGSDIDRTINDHIAILTDYYKNNGFTGFGTPRNVRKNFIVIICSFDESNLANVDVLPDHLWYFFDEMKDFNASGNPYRLIEKSNDKKSSRNLKDGIVLSIIDKKVGEDKFVLMTNLNGTGIVLPITTSESGIDIGAFNIKVKHKNGENGRRVVEHIEFTHKKIDEYGILITKKIKDSVSDLKGNCKEVTENPISPGNTYKLEEGVTQKIKNKLSEMITGIKGMSPINLNDDAQFEDLNFSVSGSVSPTLSLFNQADISFAYNNGNFISEANLPLEKLSKNFPKPFKVKYCGVTVYASSQEGLSVSGDIGFEIANFGEGEITAKSTQNGLLSFGGRFNFNNKYFNPAEVTVGYNNNNWNFSGTIGLNPKSIKGIKQAQLTIGYNEEGKKLSLEGIADLTIPGIDRVKLSAEIDESNAFALKAGVTLGKLPGIKEGSIAEVFVYSTGDGIKLGMRGKARPDFPSIPELDSELEVSYEDGIFNARAFVQYQKGRFGGAIEVGVTNTPVNEKGEPQKDAGEESDVRVYGHGKLAIEIFKGINGEVLVRLTPEKKLLAGGKVAVQKGLTPFGGGKEFTHPLFLLPTIKIPLFGVPGFSLYCKITGGAFFAFKWLPLQIHELQIGFAETDIDNIENTVVEVIGQVGSMATAETYLVITATIGAEALVAKLEASLSGKAGVRVSAIAGGSLDAQWNNQKGLVINEITAYLNVQPEAFYELVGKLRIYLDLWLTTVTLYSKQWQLASGQTDFGALNLALGLPVKFDENGAAVMPPPQAILENKNTRVPSEKDGETIMDGALNADARREREETKAKLRADIENEMRTSRHRKDFSPSRYSESLMKKYNKDAEMKAFIASCMFDTAKRMEYEEFYAIRTRLLNSDKPYSDKMSDLTWFRLFRWLISPADYKQLEYELYAAEETKRLAETQKTNAKKNAEHIQQVAS